MKLDNELVRRILASMPGTGKPPEATKATTNEPEKEIVFFYEPTSRDVVPREKAPLFKATLLLDKERLTTISMSQVELKKIEEVMTLRNLTGRTPYERKSN